MLIVDELDRAGYEQVAVFTDAEAGLQAIVAIHDTTLGPACGGARIWPYTTEEEALRDVLLLSRAMTYKAAVAGLGIGGDAASSWRVPEPHRLRVCHLAGSLEPRVASLRDTQRPGGGVIATLQRGRLQYRWLDRRIAEDDGPDNRFS